MKRFISLFLSVILLTSSLFSLSACKGKEDKKEGSDANFIDISDLNFTPEDGKCYAVIAVKDFGKIVVELLPDYAPITVEHFINVVNSGFYSGTTFHRILSDFMIQGGAPKSGSASVSPIVGEFYANGYTYNTLSHSRGVISMARTGVMDSATTQFFICNADYPSLNGQYAAFGIVIIGMDVVDAITEHGMQYTSRYQNGIIYDESKQPVIEKAMIIDKR